MSTLDRLSADVQKMLTDPCGSGEDGDFALRVSEMIHDAKTEEAAANSTGVGLMFTELEKVLAADGGEIGVRIANECGEDALTVLMNTPVRELDEVMCQRLSEAIVVAGAGSGDLVDWLWDRPDLAEG